LAKEWALLYREHIVARSNGAGHVFVGNITKLNSGKKAHTPYNEMIRVQVDRIRA